MNYFLGIDGGQSHTTALLGDSCGRIIGRGQAGPSNHTREPRGRERLTNAIIDATSGALRSAGLLKKRPLREFQFTGAHLAMTGEPRDKVAIVRGLLRAGRLVVGHDAPGALAGALAGEEGIVVLAGTGSVACGEATRRGQRRFARVGGHGYLFGDEGSAFAIAREALAGALNCEDLGGKSGLQDSLLAHFKRPKLKTIAQDFYSGEISRDRLAAFAMKVDQLADRGDETARALMEKAAGKLAMMAVATAINLGLAQKALKISYGGGMFKSKGLLGRFETRITDELPSAVILAPRFDPAVGALLLAYRDSDRTITRAVLLNIEQTHGQR
jgi:N-acetylglucosamine kinase-like BadF-type ATPase